MNEEERNRSDTFLEVKNSQESHSCGSRHEDAQNFQKLFVVKLSINVIAQREEQSGPQHQSNNARTVTCTNRLTTLELLVKDHIYCSDLATTASQVLHLSYSAWS